MALRSLPNEIEILQAVANGDEIAFGKLFYFYHNQLAEFIVSITRCEEITEEIVQDIFLKIWNNRENLYIIKKFNSYLFILTRNHTLNAIRKLSAEKQRQKIYLEVVESESALEEDEEYLALFDTAISQLPPQQQKVFLLKQQGFKNAEVAAQMELSPASVKKYQQWAIQSITKFIKAKAALTTLLITNFL